MNNNNNHHDDNNDNIENKGVQWMAGTGGATSRALTQTTAKRKELQVQLLESKVMQGCMQYIHTYIHTVNSTSASARNCKFNFWNLKLKSRATTPGSHYTPLCGM